MEEVKNEQGEAKVEEATPVVDDPKKKKGGKTALIIVFVLIGLLLLCAMGTYFGLRGYVSDLFEQAEEVIETIDEDLDDPVGFVVPEIEEDMDDPFMDEEVESDLPGVNDDMDGADLISERFPEDIPVSGGKIISSSFDQWSVKVDIQTSSSVEEVYTWYEEAFADTDWVVTSKSREDTRASINFTNGEERGSDEYRSGDVSILRYDWRDYTEITIRERY